MIDVPARRYLVGTVFLAVITLLIGLLVQVYRHALPWEHTVSVSLVTPAAGLSLDPPADVKLRGVIVGEVRTVTADGNDATLHLAISPSKQKIIPANVDAVIVPKTLFGQKYVNLILPEHPSAARIASGAVIRPSAHSVEIEQVFNDLLPVLQTLQPTLVSSTLSAMATALDGRGTELGTTITELSTYLDRLDPHVPTLIHDITALAATSKIYADNAANLIRTLDDATAITAQLLIPQRAALDSFLDHVTAFAKRATGVIQQDGADLVTLAGQTLPVLRLLAQYSIALPCLVHGFAVGNSLTDHALGGAGPYLRVTVDLPSKQNAVYSAPKDLQSNATSDANLNQLDKNITTYAPYCTQVQTQIDNLPDVAPLSYNYNGAGSAHGVIESVTTSSTHVGIGTAGSASEIAVTRSLGATSANAGLSDVLLGPLLHYGVSVP